MPVDITVQGGYHQIGSFLAELANMRRIVTVSTVRLSAATANPAGATTAASFSASAYSLNSSPTSPPPAPPAASATPPEDKKGVSKNGQKQS
jgi:Tfp pilus assembly protein PilO